MSCKPVVSPFLCSMEFPKLSLQKMSHTDLYGGLGKMEAACWFWCWYLPSPSRKKASYWIAMRTGMPLLWKANVGCEAPRVISAPALFRKPISLLGWLRLRCHFCLFWNLPDKHTVDPGVHGIYGPRRFRRCIFWDCWGAHTQLQYHLDAMPINDFWRGLKFSRFNHGRARHALPFFLYLGCE